jgi:hypothetical protein
MTWGSHVDADPIAQDVRKLYLETTTERPVVCQLAPKAETVEPHLTTWSTHPVPSKLKRVLISITSFSRRSCGVSAQIWRLVLHRHKRRK